MAADLTELPAGFKLDAPAASGGGGAGLPQGFKLDGPAVASGPLEAIQAGYQGSATGLAIRGKLPDVVLDPQHAKWYEKALSSVAQMGSEIPEMIGGAAVGGIAGTAAGGAVGNVPGAIVGGVLGTGAGAFAVPAAIRTSLIEAYKSGTVDSSGGFLNSAKIVLKETGKEALIGAATFGAGGVAARTVGKAIAPAIGETISVGTGRAAIGTAGTAAEIGTMVVAPAALDGHLPEWSDFVNAAIVVGFAKGAIHVATPGVNALAGKLGDIYAKTGIRPEQVVVDAKADPEIAADLAAETKPGEPEIPRAYQPVAEAEMLANALPEAPKVAEIIANPRGTIPDGKQPNHINYRYTESAEDVQSLRAKIAETLKPEIEAARGKESWDQTQAKAERVIKDRLAGMSDDQKAELGKMTFSDLAAQSMAVEAMAQKAAFDARQAANEIAAKGADVTPEDHARLVAAIETSALLHAVDQGNGAEIARALTARKAASQRGELAEGMSKLLADYSYDPRILARMVLGLHTTAEMTRFAKDAAKATTWEKVIEAWKAGILSGPVTHMANVIGNTTFMAMRPIVDLTAAMIGKATGMEQRVSAAEPFARVLGNLQGAKDALVAAGQMLRLAYEEGGLKGALKEAAVGSEVESAGKTEQFRKAIGGTLGDVVRLPFRALSVADEFFKTMNAQGEKYALATRKAIEEGHNIQTREFRERVADLVQNDAEIGKAADAAALRFTFNTPLGEKGQSIQQMVRANHLELIVPFIRTPANIFKEMIRMTPLAPLMKETRAAWEAGGAERAKVVAEIAMGTTIGAVIASYVMDGSISGQGSPDPGKRKVAAAAGWQPYSVNIGDKWYSYQRVQPLGTLIGMAADLAEVYEHMTEGENNKATTMLSVAFANAVTQQTFLQGFTSIVQAFADPQRYGPRWVQQYAGSIVPAIVAQPTAMYDPVQREVNGLLDAVKARIPGLRQTLLQKRDYFGEPIGTKDRLGGMLPINEATESADKVRLEAYRLGLSAPDAPKKIHLGRGTGKAGDVVITDEQRNHFTEVSGHLANEILQPIVNAPSWDSMPKPVQERIYKKVFTVARTNAARTVFTPEEASALIGTISERVQDSMRPQ